MCKPLGPPRNFPVGPFQIWASELGEWRQENRIGGARFCPILPTSLFFCVSKPKVHNRMNVRSATAFIPARFRAHAGKAPHRRVILPWGSGFRCYLYLVPNAQGAFLGLAARTQHANPARSRCTELNRHSVPQGQAFTAGPSRATTRASQPRELQWPGRNPPGMALNCTPKIAYCSPTLHSMRRVHMQTHHLYGL